jgi:hypothetical protein
MRANEASPASNQNPSLVLHEPVLPADCRKKRE